MSTLTTKHCNVVLTLLSISLAVLSEEFARRFANSDVPPLPKLLAMLSTATHKTTTNHFYATVVGSKDLIPLYLEVVLWMLKRDLLIRLHLRIRIIATEQLKKRVRKQWEEHVMRKRSRSRARSITRGSRERRGSREGSRRGRRRRDAGADADSVGETAGPALESVSESSPVEYWVSLSPKTMRKQARGQQQPSVVIPSGGKTGQAEDEEREKHDELDEEFLSSSADEAKWNEYYRNGEVSDIASIISDPARAKPLERRWLAGMSEGKDPVIVRRFERYVRKLRINLFVS